MDIIRTIAEKKLEEAIKNGDFDDLVLKGMPIPEDEFKEVSPDFKMSYKILKNYGVVPKEIELKKELEKMKELVNCEQDKDKKSTL